MAKQPETSIKRRYKQLTQKARRFKKRLSISIDLYTQLVSINQCYYCNGPLEPTTGHSLDRIDNAKGYLRENVVPCCGSCNLLRGSLLTPEETRDIVSYLKKKRKTDLIWSKRRGYHGIQKRKRRARREV